MLTSINLKNGYSPYFSSQASILNSRIDNDTFPYPRWFKGQYNLSNPVIDPRRAGWSPTYANQSFKLNNDMICCSSSEDYDLIFQPACSTVLPTLNTKKKINIIKCD
jgi:hypothetical protein